MRPTQGMPVDFIYQSGATVHYIEKKPNRVEFVRAYPNYLLFRSWYDDRSYCFCVNRGMLKTREVRIRKK